MINNCSILLYVFVIGNSKVVNASCDTTPCPEKKSLRAPVLSMTSVLADFPNSFTVTIFGKCCNKAIKDCVQGRSADLPGTAR